MKLQPGNVAMFVQVPLTLRTKFKAICVENKITMSEQIRILMTRIVEKGMGK